MHKITAEDVEVRGHPGTKVTCVCGWSDKWSVRDGSAEDSGYHHVVKNDSELQKKIKEEVALRRNVVASPVLRIVPTVSSKPHEHNCSCHINPPCSQCENCNHWDIEGCDNDCQTCDIDHDEER